MFVITFIIILGILIFVHELGHFLAAKGFGVRVDEFALGFPPRIVSKKFGQTEYVLNALPIGGYVKIVGEDGLPEGEDKNTAEKKGKMFTDISRWKQAVILVSGILGNLLFAWFALSIGFMMGLPASANGPFADQLASRSLIVTSVAPDSPADSAGLLPSDRIVELKRENLTLSYPDADKAIDLISGTPEGTPIDMTVIRNKSTTTLQAFTKEGIVPGKRGIGISMEYGGILQLPVHKAVVAGAYATVEMTKGVSVGIYGILSDAVRGQAELSSFTGPVGIAVMVGDAERAGFVSLLILVVIISVNLAVINIVPLPALDGGRLLFVIIESITRKPINAKFARTANQIGIVALLILMAVITFKDISKLIS